MLTFITWLAQLVARAQHKSQDAVFVALRNEAGEVFLVRGPRSLGLVWQFVGGKVEPTDVDSVSAIIREVREEIGIQLDVKDLRPTTTAPFEFGGGKIQFFEAFLKEESRIRCDSAEITESRWVPIREAVRMRSWPSTQRSLSLLS